MPHKCSCECDQTNHSIPHTKKSYKRPPPDDFLGLPAKRRLVHDDDKIRIIEYVKTEEVPKPTSSADSSIYDLIYTEDEAIGCYPASCFGKNIREIHWSLAREISSIPNSPTPEKDQAPVLEVWQKILNKVIKPNPNGSSGDEIDKPTKPGN